MDNLENPAGVSGCILDLVRPLLPSDLSLQEIMGDAAIKEDSQTESIECALRNCTRLNWEAYLGKYPDVANAGADPVRHFLDYGVHEGRRLTSWHPFHTERACPGQPRVSIILPNYNNELFLNKSLSSLVNQSLQEIEIIVVDDHSQDGSLGVINKFAQQDPRIKVIALPENKGTHMVRKAGVLEASGEYVMFLDADDFYEPNACQTAYETIKKGYDIVTFNINVINHSRFGSHEFAWRYGWYNKLPAGFYEGDEKLGLAYIKGIIPHFLWNKIFERQLIQTTFKMMEDGHYTLYEDQYEFLISVYYARNLYKIDNILINYFVGDGITGNNDQFLNPRKLLLHGAILRPIETFCCSNNLIHILENEKIFLIRCAFENLSRLTPDMSDKYFRGICDQFGTEYVLEQLCLQFYERQNILAEKLKYIKAKKTAIKLVALVCSTELDKNQKMHLVTIIKEQQSLGCKVILFSDDLDKFASENIEFEDYFYVSSSGKSKKDMSIHCRYLYQAVTYANPDCLIFGDVSSSALVYDLACAKLLNIKAIGVYSIFFAAQSGKTPFAGYLMINALKAFDHLVCADPDSASFFMSQGINAKNSSVCNTDVARPCKKEHPSIWVFLDTIDLDNINQGIDNKQAVKGRLECESLMQLLMELAKQSKQLKIYMEAELKSSRDRKKLLDILEKHGLKDNTRLLNNDQSTREQILSADFALVQIMEPGYWLNLAMGGSIPVICYKNQVASLLDENNAFAHIGSDTQVIVEYMLRIFRKGKNFANNTETAENSLKLSRAANLMCQSSRRPKNDYLRIIRQLSVCPKTAMARMVKE